MDEEALDLVVEAELRNAIRHSREITGVMIKDGEAALLWFEETLAVS